MITVVSIQRIIDKQGFLLLDGGLATELERRDFDLNTPLWSAHLLQTHPEAIKDIHRTYLEAGADCIICASYQASLAGFYHQGFSKTEAENLLRKSVSLALEARDEYLESRIQRQKTIPLIAASIGPYGAYLANGAEYHGNYQISRAELRAFHQPRWEILSDSGADFLACETIPNIEEAQVFLEILEESPGSAAWMSFSCKDGCHISDGTPITEAAELLKESQQVLAIGVNCTPPNYVSSLVKKISKAAPEKLIVVYPNSGESYDGENRCWTGSADSTAFATSAQQWYKAGAKLIGGCCRTGPQHIRSIREALLR